MTPVEDRPFDFLSLLFPGCFTPLDIITALDASGSVRKENWVKSVDFAAKLAKKLLALNTESRMGVIDFSAVSNEAIQPSNDQKFLEKELGNLKDRYQNGVTRTELALLKAWEIFLRINRSAAKKLLIIVTDGRTTPLNNKQGIELLQEPMDNLRTEGVYCIAVGVGDLINNEELNFMATGPNEENVFHIHDYDKLVDMVDTISQTVCKEKGKTTCVSLRHKFEILKKIPILKIIIIIQVQMSSKWKTIPGNAQK